MKRRLLLIPIAVPAAMAIWSGWVGLGGLCGFGVVNLLPGIGAGFTINTAITLPVGVEAYGAYALGVWVGVTGGEKARRFAMWSALGALAYGMLGQVVYHLLAAAHVTAAPWPIVVMVSCMPVIVLGFAAALTHLLAGSEDVAGEPDPAQPAPRPPAVPARVPIPRVREIRERRGCSQATAEKARAEVRLFASKLGPYPLDPPAGTAPASPPVPAGVNGNGAHV